MIKQKDRKFNYQKYKTIDQQVFWWEVLHQQSMPRMG